MSNKSLLKFIAAFGILAVILVFPGVNYVPSIFASSSSKNNWRCCKSQIQITATSFTHGRLNRN